MAQWQISDPNTNQTLTVEGDVAPSQQDANEIFAQHNAQQNQQQAQTPAPQPTYGGGWLSMPQGVTGENYWQGMGGKVSNELQNMVQGLGTLGGMALAASPPGELYRHLAAGPTGVQPGAQDLAVAGQVAKTLPSAVGNAVQDIYHTVRYPVQSFYYRPVGTTMDAATLALAGVKAVKGLKTLAAQQAAGKELSQQLMQSAADNPQDFAKFVNNMAAGTPVEPSPEVGAALTQASDVLSPEQIESTVGKAGSLENQAANLYAQAFTVPTKRARDLRTLDTVKQVGLKWGIGGEPLDVLRQKIQNVIRTIGGVNSDVVDNLPDFSAKDANEVIDNIAKTSTEIGPDDVKALKNTIARVLPMSDEELLNVPPEQQAQFMANLKAMGEKAAQGTLTGPHTQQALAGTGLDAGQAMQQGGAAVQDIGFTQPSNAMDLVRQLEEKAAEYRLHDTYLTPNMRMSQLGDMYQSAARAIENAMTNTAGANNVIDAYKTPELVQSLQEISPQMADDFVNNVHTLRQARAFLAAPMRFREMIDLTQQAQLSAAHQLAQQAGAALTSGAARAVGVPGIIASRYGPAGMLGRLTAPFTAPGISNMLTSLPSQLTGMALAMPQAAGNVSVLSNALSNLGALGTVGGAGLKEAFLRNFASGNNQPVYAPSTAQQIAPTNLPAPAGMSYIR